MKKKNIKHKKDPEYQPKSILKHNKFKRHRFFKFYSILLNRLATVFNLNNINFMNLNMSKNYYIYIVECKKTEVELFFFYDLRNKNFLKYFYPNI